MGIYHLERGQAGVETTLVETLKIEVLSPRGLLMEESSPRNAGWSAGAHAHYLPAALTVFIPTLQLS